MGSKERPSENCKILIKNGANKNARIQDRSALEIAIMNGHIDITQFLLESIDFAFVDIRALENYGITLLQTAIPHNQPKIVKFLIEYNNKQIEFLANRFCDSMETSDLLKIQKLVNF